ncbi:MAG: DUF6573 family protein [Syntrophobacter sp.]
MPEVVFSYSRADALADGVLVDVSELAREAGFKLPVAVSDTLYHGYLTPPPELAKGGISVEGRLWDTLSVLRYAIKASPATDRITFTVLFAQAPDAKPEPVELLAVCGPGDSGEPVITIMTPSDE